MPYSDMIDYDLHSIKSMHYAKVIANLNVKQFMLVVNTEHSVPLSTACKIKLWLACFHAK